MKTVILSKPLTGARGPVSLFRFREPNFSDFMELGEPETPIYQSGSVLIQQHPIIIGQYAEKLLVDEDVNLLRLASLRDTLAIRDAVLDFFQEARKADTPSPATPTNSSFTPPSNGTPEASSG